VENITCTRPPIRSVIAGQLGHSSNARRSKVDLAGIGLGVGDEFGDRLGLKRWMHDQDERTIGNASDRSDIAAKIETEVVVDGRVDCIRRAAKEERVTIWRCTHHRLGAQTAAGPAAIFDDEWLAESFR